MSNNIDRIIRDVYNVFPKSENYDFISEFTFIWGVFENKFREDEKSLTIQRIYKVLSTLDTDKLIKSDKLNLPKHTLVEFENNDVFVSIYGLDYRVKLLCQKKDFEIFSRKFKDKDIIESTDKNVVFLFCFIAYRLRNNLFHGNKIFNEIYEQKDLFKIINAFLTELVILNQSRLHQ